MEPTDARERNYRCLCFLIDWRKPSDDLAHSSIRFGLGRFTTEEEIDYAIDLLKGKIAKLRELSPLWEMYKDGIDINSIQWAAH